MRATEEDPLSRTDTWVIKALQEVDQPDENYEQPTRHLRPVAEPSVRVRPIEPKHDVTTDVGDILSRIEELERELESARSESQQWQSRCSELTTARAQQEERAAVLTANNARLVEQQQIAYDRTQALEGRLREEGELAARQLTELQSTLQSERDTFSEFKRTIEVQLGAARSQIESLTREHAQLHNSFSAQSELAERRAKEIVELQASLAHQHRAASEMARLLASKMTEYDLLAANLERRETALAALEHARAKLSEQLHETAIAERQRSDELAQTQAKLAQAQRTHEDLQHLLHERRQDITDREALLEQLRGDLRRIIKERDTARADHATGQAELTNARKQLEVLERERDGLAGELEQTLAKFAQRSTELNEVQRVLVQRDEALGRHEHEAAAQADVVGSLRAELADTHAQLMARIAEIEQAHSALADRERAIHRHEEEAAAQAIAVQRLRAEAEQTRASSTDLAARVDELTADRDALREQLQNLTTSAADREAALSQTQADLDRTRQALERTQALADERASELQREQDALTELHASSAAAKGSFEQATAQVAALQASVEQQTRDLEAQTLELAASRAEVARQARALEDVEHAVQLRDDLLHTLRQELQSAQDERSIMTLQLDKTRARTKALAERIFKKDASIAALKAELAVHSEALATLRSDRNEDAQSQLERILEPVGGEGEMFVLKHKVITVGRTDDNDVCIPSKMVSRRHARLLVGPNAVIVEDSGSTNGCFVNGRQVRKHLLREGDVLLIGDYKFKLRTREKAAAGG